MKKSILSFSLLTLTCYVLNAQNTVNLEMQAAYANQLWFDFSSERVEFANATNWDIAFQTGGFGTSGIRINDGHGVSLHVYPGSVDDFASLDTTGMSVWDSYHNSSTNWNEGAFNQISTSNFDLGWGEYDVVTHAVTGSRIFVIHTLSGDYQKILIESLQSGVYTFRHASLDNVMDMSHTVVKADYSDKNYVYFNLESHSVVDNEPLAADWSITFTKYMTLLGGGVSYPVTGVLSNAGVEVMEIADTPFLGVADTSGGVFSSDADVIGYDWKNFDFTTGWTLVDDLTYLVKTRDKAVYKMAFTSFEGSSTGKLSFDYELVYQAPNATDPAYVRELNNPFVQVFPNPTSGYFTFAYDFANPSQLRVVNLQGKEVHNQSLKPGFANEFVNIEALPKGIYVLQVLSENSLIYTDRIIKN